MLEVAAVIDPPSSPQSALPLDARLVDLARRGSELATASVVVIGCLVVTGWLLDVQILKTVLPGFPTMKANAAVGFIAAGLSLWIIRDENRGLKARLSGQALALATLLIGFLTWVEYEFDQDFGIDEWYFKGTPPGLTAKFPGRMAQLSAIHFTICGLTLLLIDFRLMRRFRPSTLMALVGACSSLFVSYAYAYGSSPQDQIFDSPAISLHAAMGFLLLFLAILLARPEREPVATIVSDSLGGLIARKLLPTLIVTFFLLGLARIVGSHAGLFEMSIGVTLLVTSSSFITSGIILWHARAIGYLDRERRNAELSLESSEARFRQLADAMPQIVWTSPADGHIDYYNERWYEFTGLPRGTTGDGSWKPILHADDVEKCVNEWYRSIRTGEPYEIEYRFYDRICGCYRWQLGRALPVRDDSGQITRWFGTSTDIDERKRSEDARQEGDERFRALVETLPQLVWGTGPDGTHEYASPQWAEYLGYSGMDEVGARWFDAMHPDDQPAFLAIWSGVLERGESLDTEYRLRRHDGKYRWFKGRGTPLRGPDGQILRWFGTATDIDDQKRAEEAIRSSERIYRAIGESIPFGVWICAPDGTNTYASESFLNLVGMTQDQCSRFGWLDALHPDDAKQTLESWQECVRAEENWEIEHRFRGTDGLYHQRSAKELELRRLPITPFQLGQE